MKKIVLLEISGCHECPLIDTLFFNNSIGLQFCDNSLLIGKGKFSVFREIEKKIFHSKCPLNY